jgi:hypothetical protein
MIFERILWKLKLFGKMWLSDCPLNTWSLRHAESKKCRFQVFVPDQPFHTPCIAKG